MVRISSLGLLVALCGPLNAGVSKVSQSREPVRPTLESPEYDLVALEQMQDANTTHLSDLNLKRQEMIEHMADLMNPCAEKWYVKRLIKMEKRIDDQKEIKLLLEQLINKVSAL